MNLPQDNLVEIFEASLIVPTSFDVEGVANLLPTNENVSQTRLIMKYVFINCKIVFALTRHFLHDYVNNVIGSEKISATS